MQAVLRQFGRRDIAAYLASGSRLYQQITDQLMQVPLCLRDVFIAVQEAGQFGIAVPAWAG